ncbi:MAG: hypothetical protein JO305_10080 [Alphaproteobacteria bacterium]|nr:hypothetical protein [Alphaproteobacteria bacterium]
MSRPAGWRHRRYWVVGRSLCAFRIFRFPSADRSGLRSFAALKAREWAPYAEVGFHAHLTGDAATIWAWDGARARDAMLSTAVRPARLAVVPETAMQRPGQDGTRLIACVEGFDGQVWSAGELSASRWWPHLPSRDQWRDFCRGGGISGLSNGGPPSAEPALWRTRPWTNSGEGFGIERRGREALAAGVALMLAGYGYVGGSFARDELALQQTTQRLRQVEQQAAPAIADRAQALANLQYLADFEKLNPYPSQLAVLAQVAEKLPSNGAQIIAWSYQEGELQFTVQSKPPPDILFYVKTYSDVPGFTQVTADRADAGGLRIKLRLGRS